MDSTFPMMDECVTVKQEVVSDYETSQSVDNEQGNLYHDGNHDHDKMPATWSMYAENVTESSESKSTVDDSDIDDDAAVMTDRRTRCIGDDLFQYDAESDSDENDTNTLQHHKQDVGEKLPWTRQVATTELRPFSPAVAGPTSEASKTLEAPVDFFHQFFPEELYKEAQIETNNYAEYYQEKRRDLGRDWWEWTDTRWHAVESKQDIKKFLGVCITMAVHTLPDPRDYWSRKKHVCNTLIARSGMTMHHFERVMNYFYLSNPWRDPEKIANPERRVEACSRDPLYKVNKTLHEHVKRSCRAHYQPHRDMVIKELTRNVKSKTDIKTKGWRLLVLKDAYTGYITDLQWYRDTDVNSENSSQGMTQEKALTGLVKNLSGLGHCLYADSVFISPTMAMYFTELGTHVTTDCSNWPGDICTSGDIEVGSTLSVQYKVVTATMWKGKRLKRCLSTMHNGQMQSVTLKLCHPTTREYSIKTVPCPLTIANHMTLVGILPQCLLLSEGTMVQKLTNSWWKRLVWLLIDICMNNAYVMWTESRGNCLSLTEFAMEVASKLMGYPSKACPKRYIEVSTVPATSEETAEASSSHNAAQKAMVSYSMVPEFQVRYPELQPSAVSEASDFQEVVQPDRSSPAHESTDADTDEHCLVKFPGRGRNCRQCCADRRRTRSGRRRDTQFGCSACRVNLCRSGCFVRFHEAHGINISAASMAEVRMQPDPPPYKRMKHSF
ncbi:piggyBac transposable element-derived protein 5-like [Patiria miniata]|uniref:PiggyBac transposable element-derived protein domain-containing protein n=1 Tax=Patiria miniata TaxID=46514 RepID=A0A914B450_PATMI|nr:piggyBac transposable element-derived protein 5-like [Patiria miniata]